MCFHRRQCHTWRAQVPCAQWILGELVRPAACDLADLYKRRYPHRSGSIPMRSSQLVAFLDGLMRLMRFMYTVEVFRSQEKNGSHALLFIIPVRAIACSCLHA